MPRGRSAQPKLSKPARSLQYGADAVVALAARIGAGPLNPAARAAGLLGGRLSRSSRLAGGDLSEVVAIGLDDGREAVVKGGPAPRTEARMLAAIRAAGAAAPAVLAVDDSVLVLERLDDRGRLDDAWPELGRVLATLHAALGARYGWDEDYAFGDVAIENAASDDWCDFWAARRLRNQLRHLPRKIAARVDALAGDLGNRLPQRPRAALLHGDLWSGNVLTANGRVSGLVDPACYYGHCEVDFAMLRLFAAPDDALFETYGPLEPGHEARLPIYQLWPALVHYRLFGGGYLGMVDRLLAQARV